VFYRGACNSLANLPEARPTFEKRIQICVGFPAPELPDTYTLEVGTAPEQGRTEKTFTAKASESGTWLSYYSDYLEDLKKWTMMMGFSYVSERLVFVDTTNPLSALAMAALPKLENTLVFAIVADEASTPVDQNTSYASLQALQRLRVPTILATKSFTNDLVAFFEDEGLVVKEDALRAIWSFILGSATSIVGIMNKDDQLGVRAHGLSATVSGSRTVFRSTKDAIELQMKHRSVDALDSEVQTVYLVAKGRSDSLREIGDAFNGQARKFTSIMNAQKFLNEGDSRYELYTVVTIYGIKGDKVVEAIEKGYEKIASRSGKLKVEMLK
jgi:hypothetical protein